MKPTAFHIALRILVVLSLFSQVVCSYLFGLEDGCAASFYGFPVLGIEKVLVTLITAVLVIRLFVVTRVKRQEAIVTLVFTALLLVFSLYTVDVYFLHM